MMRNLRALLMLLVLGLFASVEARAASCTLRGVVKLDRRGVPGVTVTVVSPSLARARSTVSDLNGRYSLRALPPGEYSIHFEKEGLQTVARNVTLEAGRSARLNMRLAVPEIAEAITITATAPAIVDVHEIQTGFDAELIDSLPISRNLQSTAALAPGVHNTGPGASETHSVLAISGAPSFDSLYLVDGTVVNENVRGQAHALYIEDAIVETTIMTGAISAEYGRFTGGVVSTITKSGGNEFSGSLRDTLSNPSWSSSHDGREPLDEINQVFEGTLGGRIFTDRLWFFSAGRFFSTQRESYFAGTDDPFIVSTDESRFEAKLTGQLAPNHSLVFSRTQVEMEQENNCQFGCMEESTVDPHVARPSSATSLRYNGILGRSAIITANASTKKFGLRGFGGDSPDPATGSWGLDAAGTNAFFGAPLFCASCGDHDRDSENYLLRASFHSWRPRWGSHEVVIGAEHWIEETVSDNFQSASNFGIVTFKPVERDGRGIVTPVFEPGSTLVTWYPIFEPTQGTSSSTTSIFLNDRIDLSGRWSFNLGVRYDDNLTTNGAGTKVADDAEFSPRLAATFDPHANGRLRFNASYSRYVTRIVGSIGDLGSGAGTPAYFSWAYQGPPINTDRNLPTAEAMALLFDWFFANGGTGQRPVAVSIPGITATIEDSLVSPSVDEWTIGAASMIGRGGFIRADLINRNWQNFYSMRTDLSTGQVIDGFGQGFDRSVIGNTDDLSRRYRAVQLQGGYRLYGRLEIGGNYTWSRLEGNVMEETMESGPVANEAESYPEYNAFERRNPIGILAADQTHKFRLWAEIAIPSYIGQIHLSMLQRFDSGRPYELRGFVPVSHVENPGYANPPTRAPYYFSDRGALRWDDTTATDLALSFAVPVSRATAFFQADVINLFDERAQVGGNTTVHTAMDDRTLLRFDPWTDTPVEGVHYRKGRSFGRPEMTGHYQQPRTFQISAGIRF